MRKGISSCTLLAEQIRERVNTGLYLVLSHVVNRQVAMYKSFQEGGAVLEAFVARRSSGGSEHSIGRQAYLQSLDIQVVSFTKIAVRFRGCFPLCSTASFIGKGFIFAGAEIGGERGVTVFVHDLGVMSTEESVGSGLRVGRYRMRFHSK